LNRRSRPVVLGGGLVAIAVAAAMTVAALSGGHGGGGGAGGSLTAGRAGRPSATRPAASQPAASQPAAPAGASASVRPDPSPTATLTGMTTPRLIVPDVIATVPGGLTAADLKRLSRVAGVRAVLPIDGAKITVDGTPMTVLAAPADELRPWTPPSTAANQLVWSAFAQGDLITTPQLGMSTQMVTGARYPAVAAVRTTVTFGGSTLLGISGVDGIIDAANGARLGLVKNVAVLVDAPANSPLALVTQVERALGAKSRVVRLVPAQVSTSLPVDVAPPAGQPGTYIQLFQESAARYCSGLSWTVLAAIGQIESGDGQNMGPSTAGALGPMQFLPSTWAVWGIDGFGDTGPPDIMNPFDAVPSAARLLCADGATDGGAGLRQAIFDYNHADWYVDEVLTLAGEYASESR
jgi:hypothetical protein